MKTTVKERKKDIRTIRKEHIALGFFNIRFSVWGYHWERTVDLPNHLKMEFIDGDDKARCNWAKDFIIQLTDGEFNQDDLLAMKINGIDLLNFSEQKWIDGSDVTFKQPVQ